MGGARFGEFALFAYPLLRLIEGGYAVSFRLQGSVARGDLLGSAGRCRDRVAPAMLTIGRHGGHATTMFPAQAGSFMSFTIESPPLLRAICSTVAARSRRLGVENRRSMASGN
jgi:hypothetical protein